MHRKETSIKERGSNAVRSLELAWAEICRVVSGLPPVVMVVICAGARRRKNGHFAGSAWRYRKDIGAHEVGINPELFAHPEALLSTMLHEAAHALLFASTGATGCSGRYYHLKTFRDMCQRLGLKCEFLNTRYGWTLTQLPDSGVPECYQTALKVLGDLPLGVGNRILPGRIQGNAVLPKPGHMRLVCQCPRTIYVSHSVLSEGGVFCRRCQQEFTAGNATEKT